MVETARQQDIRRVAKILRDGGYGYDASKHLIREAREQVGLTPPKRKRVSKQLNKGENLHRLRSRLFYGEFGEVQGQEDEALDQQVACLNLVTNAVVVYNTVHMASVVDELRGEGVVISDDDLGRVWPSRFRHINILGKYYFDQTKMRLGEDL